jgi:ABC-type branched-subunit amino acid transport system substrate-binding protein
VRVLLLLFAVVASGMTASKAAQAQEIVIGLIGVYSGLLVLADDEQTRTAVSATVSEINDGGGVLGKKLALISRDTESNPVAALASAAELVEAQNAQFILLHCGQTCAVLVSSRLQEYKVSSAAVPTGTPNPADEAKNLLKAWVERVKAAGKFNLSGGD